MMTETQITDALADLADSAPEIHVDIDHVVSKAKRWKSRRTIIATATTVAVVGVLAAGTLVVVKSSPVEEAPATLGRVGEWTSTPVPGGRGVFLTGVSAAGASDAWAVGINHGKQSTSSVIQHWDGRSWQAVPNIPAGTLWNVRAISADDVWVLGGSEDKKFLALHWDGHTWTRTDVPSPPAGDGLETITVRDVAAVAGNDVWAVGCRMAGGPGLPTTGLLVHWDGRKWSNVPLPQIPENGFGMCTVSVAARSSNDVFVSGEVYNGPSGGSRYFARHWDGHQWTDVETLSNGRPGLTMRVVSVDGDVWAIGGIASTTGSSGREAILSRWTDHGWQSVDVRGAGIESVGSVVADGHGGILAFSGLGTSMVTLARVSKDNKVTREPGPPGFLQLRDVAAVPGTSKVWAVGVGLDEGPAAAYVTW